MLTKARSRVGRKFVALESLESRIVLSTVAGDIAVSTMQSMSHHHGETTFAAHAVEAATKAASQGQLLFGDSVVAPSGATSVDITGYSVMSGAQIEYVNGTPDVGYMSTTAADIEYRLTVSAAGTYQLNFGVAAERWGSFDLSVNGSLQAQYSFLATGAWQSYSSTSQTVTLSAGTNVIKISPTWASQFNIRSITLTAMNVSTTTPATTTPTTTVGTSATITADKYSAIYNSQLETQGGQADIGYVSTSGAYVEYTLNVQTTGNYTFSINTAETGAAAFDILVNGAKQTTVNVGATGAWSNFNATTGTVYLTAGTDVIRFSADNGTQYNLGTFSLSQTGATAPVSTPATPVIALTNSATITADQYSAIYNSKLESQGGQADIGYVSTSGAYVEYTLNVQTTGTYAFKLNTAEASTASFDVLVNGVKQTTVNVGATGGWASFVATTANLNLTAGTNVIRFVADYGTQYNLGTISVTPYVAPSAPSASGSFDASVGTQWMTSFNQLNVIAGSSNDTIYVSQSGSVITVNVNGVSNTYAGSFGDIVVKAGSGVDAITVDGSVSVDTLLYGGSGIDVLKNLTQGNATIVSIGGGIATVQGNGVNTAYWVDGSDVVNASATERAAGDVHQVSSFWGGVSTSLLGQNLTDPVGTGATTQIPNASLWGTGPTMSDVTQGQSSDCFLLAAVQTLAYNAPGKLRQMAVDLGDGTYAVQFKRNGVTSYVRVDGDLPANGPYGYGLEYAHPGTSGDLWMPIIEKAYAEFRTGASNYSSLNDGYFGSVLSDLGVSYSAFAAGNSSTLYSTISNALSSGKGVTIGTNNSVTAGAPLISDHSYTVTAAWTDSSGTQWVQVRNPWGFDGAGSDSNSGDGLVNLTIGQLNSNLEAGTIS